MFVSRPTFIGTRKTNLTRLKLRTLLEVLRMPARHAEIRTGDRYDVGYFEDLVEHVSTIALLLLPFKQSLKFLPIRITKKSRRKRNNHTRHKKLRSYGRVIDQYPYANR